tara:strand:- start:4918 stop:5379 length:462 start_codon:yes stop_codon:yes gene_type:complete
MSYCYIDLQDTNYKASLTDHKVFAKHEKPPIDRLMDIYDAYTKHHKWESVWPIYPEEFTAKHNNLIGYYDKNRLVAWSLIYCVSKHAVECEQFAWDYENPKLRLGIESMKTECAIYKELGYKIIILGESHNYKRSIDGFKIFGKENLGSTNTV